MIDLIEEYKKSISVTEQCQKAFAMLMNSESSIIAIPYQHEYQRNEMMTSLAEAFMLMKSQNFFVIRFFKKDASVSFLSPACMIYKNGGMNSKDAIFDALQTMRKAVRGMTLIQLKFGIKDSAYPDGIETKCFVDFLDDTSNDVFHSIIDEDEYNPMMQRYSIRFLKAVGNE